MTTGTHDISILLATTQVTAAQFGLDRIAAVLAADVAAHNAIVMDMVSGLADITTDRLRRYGTSVAGEMDEVDEYGRARTQVQMPGATVGFPLRRFQYAIGWTSDWFKSHTPADMAIAVQAAQKAHLRAVQREIRRAIFRSANYAWTDFLVDNVAFNVLRFINADGQAIPEGPNGEQFNGAVHTHYDAIAGGITDAGILALVTDVAEHGHAGSVQVAFNQANEAAVRALAGFVAYPDPRIVFRATDTPAQTVDITRLNNRAIGIHSGAEVWIKSWIPANYAFAYDASATDKPLAFRQRESTSLQGLRIAAELDTYPLHAQYMQAEYGVGVWTRTNGAALFFNGAAWADPTIN